MQPEYFKQFLIILAFVISLFLCCGGGSGSNGPYLISWQPNHETYVNMTGGGYKVYYSSQSGFSPGDPGVQVIDLPYESGSGLTTSIEASKLGKGTWYVKITAYSTFNGGKESEPSEEVVVKVD